MQDRKSEILSAGLAVLREDGFAGFTQPRIAARTGLRQSHLTYYFPTRVDLLAAVARLAIDNQLAAVDRMLAASSPSEVVETMSRVMVVHENTRVLMGMAQAADQTPALRELFRELTAGILERLGRWLESLDVPAAQANLDLMHALTVGLAVIDLATGRPDGQQRTKEALEAGLAMLGKAP
jgi:AcrR family transcriptional regulator